MAKSSSVTPSTVGDDETALLLDTAADASDVVGGESITYDLPAERKSHRTTTAAAGRARILDIARSAIARHHAIASRED